MYGNTTNHTQIFKIVKENIFLHKHFVCRKIAGKTFSSDLRKPFLKTGEKLVSSNKIDLVHEKITYYITKTR